MDSARQTSPTRPGPSPTPAPEPDAPRRFLPRVPAQAELPSAAFEQVRRTKETLNDFKVILTRADRVVPPFGNAIEREVSNVLAR